MTDSYQQSTLHPSEKKALVLNPWMIDSHFAWVLPHCCAGNRANMISFPVIVTWLAKWMSNYATYLQEEQINPCSDLVLSSVKWDEFMLNRNPLCFDTFL